MTKEDLIARLNDLEWEDFEVKEAKTTVPKSCWETVSTFANTTGGWLVFGVKQTGKTFTVQGVDHSEKIEQDFLNTLRGEKFNVFVPTQEHKYNIDKKTVLAFYIPVSKEKPVYFDTTMTAATIAALLDLSESTIDKDISQLKKRNIIERSGSKKSGRWAPIHL